MIKLSVLTAKYSKLYNPPPLIHQLEVIFLLAHVPKSQVFIHTLYNSLAAFMLQSKRKHIFIPLLSIGRRAFLICYPAFKTELNRSKTLNLLLYCYFIKVIRIF